IVGNVGGPGVLATDAASAHGLHVPELSPATQEALAALLPAGAALGNPVDLIASATAETYRSCLDLVLRSGEADAVIVIFTPPLGTRAVDVAEAVARTVDDAEERGDAVPVVATFVGTSSAAEILRRARRPVPCFAYPETAVRALAHVVDYGTWRARPEGAVPTFDEIDANGARRRLLDITAGVPGWVTGADAMAVLAAFGIPCAPTVPVTDAGAAAEAAAAVGWPVTLKATGPDLLHKTEAGGVNLDLSSDAEVHEAYETMQRTLGPAMSGAVVQPMVPGAVETIAGFVVDPAFGPQVLFGLGGTAVELLGDYATRLAPLTDLDAREMVLDLRSARLLTGFRGSVPMDVEALIDVVLRLGRLAEDLPEVVEADCNPVMATPQGAVVVDARLRVSTESRPAGDEARHLR
ncbi:MAG TPA: acetate--CoA ligase family protein, partial [Acidimicrobiales bacterium]|nr:acetate--CoA ligase family protein [Acidimicrobiales bacterium]